MDHKIPFGLHNGRVVHISETNPSNNGLKCNCTCPSCGDPLQARMGNIRTWHFSHSKSSCSSKSATETALHLLAKEILSEKKTLRLPEVRIAYSRDSITCEDFYNHQTQQAPIENRVETALRPSKIVHFDTVELEKRLNGIIPDLIMYRNNVPLIVEISVTHFIDNNKLRKIHEMGISAIEIELPSVFDDFYTFDRAALENLLIHETHSKYWIYNRIIEQNIPQLIENNKKYIAHKEKNQLLEAERKREEQERIKQYNIVKQEKIRQRYNSYFSPEICISRVTLHKDNLAKNQTWNTILQSLDIRTGTLPYYLNICINGEQGFDCDRRLWQSMIFLHFIHVEKEHLFSIMDIYNWIIHNKDIPINRDEGYTAAVRDSNIRNLKTTIFHYMKVLDGCGFIVRINEYPTRADATYQNILNYPAIDTILDHKTVGYEPAECVSCKMYAGDYSVILMDGRCLCSTCMAKPV